LDCPGLNDSISSPEIQSEIPPLVKNLQLFKNLRPLFFTDSSTVSDCPLLIFKASSSPSPISNTVLPARPTPLLPPPPPLELPPPPPPEGTEIVKLFLLIFTFPAESLTIIQRK